MRCIVGVDHTVESLNACRLAARLGCSEARLELVHVLERLEAFPLAEVPPDATLVDRLVKAQEAEGRAQLKAALAVAAEEGAAAVASQRAGFAANELMAAAKELSARVIAVGSEGKGTVGGLIYGSVSRKLAVSSLVSLLIARAEAVDAAPFNAVFATDHSDYADRCVQELVRLAPRGFRRLTVMTAYPYRAVEVMRATLTHFRGDLRTWIEKNLEERNQDTIRRLSSLGCELDSYVIDGPPSDAIDVAMKRAEATLLILGAQGHGVLDRITTGSISFQQAVKGRQHLLILRV